MHKFVWGKSDIIVSKKLWCSDASNWGKNKLLATSERAKMKFWLNFWCFFMLISKENFGLVGKSSYTYQNFKNLKHYYCILFIIGVRWFKFRKQHNDSKSLYNQIMPAVQNFNKMPFFQL